jgi:hypothetical protein
VNAFIGSAISVSPFQIDCYREQKRASGLRPAWLSATEIAGWVKLLEKGIIAYDLISDLTLTDVRQIVK